MEKFKRPYDTIITMIGDSFIEGQKPTEKVIDLTKVSDEELAKLSEMIPEAAFEQLWRAMSDAMDD